VDLRVLEWVRVEWSGLSGGAEGKRVSKSEVEGE